jgi:3-phenylpropionate/trans-cinnamate dioxygenase ferredoxin reductase component
MAATYQYVIIGGGLAGASAIKGIREIDPNNPILLVSAEKDLPYDRPPLTKKLWFGKIKEEGVFLDPADYYSKSGVDVLSNTRVASIDPNGKTVTTNAGVVFGFKKLLIATGGSPRALTIPGGDLPGIYYYRTFDDYRRLREEAASGKSVLIIGGGFIGTEIAAALNTNKVGVTMVFPESYFVQNVFPDYLGSMLVSNYQDRGVNVIAEDIPASISKQGRKFLVRTKKGRDIVTDIIIAGIGIFPGVELAKNAGLTVTNGIEVDKFLAASHSDIYAAGDTCNFESFALGKRIRVEHWDTAKTQGRQAGRNMAGAGEVFDYVPYFFSDLFEFGYESAGDITSVHPTYPVWKTPNNTGVIYYMAEDTVAGIMLCNVWDKVEEAREIVRAKRRYSKKELDILIKY